MDEFVSEIVRNLSFYNEILHQFADNMLTIGCTATISAKKCSFAIDKCVLKCYIYLVEIFNLRKEFRKTAEQLLNSGQSVGRRMDFLCQEFNREANTTCSKAADVQIINCGMELKATIEQLREQVQNME